MRREDPVTLDPAARYDALGRKQPHRLTFLHYARALPWLLDGFDRVVPDEFTFAAGDELVEIACPCGQTPQVTPLEAVECACGRWFLHTSRRILVNRPEAGDAPAPDTEAPAVPGPIAAG